ncbi:hypothetical protein M9H77_18692 [Catharanthus roseus]|uniref:Uncharacterized protein n=1 Tax=Catharanthus roseus TaxID=4058 RepID=A0ACC0B845_CATRO|nr:hypothetical protein M9H77_18692 [Catharanthus roseus]
MTIAQYTSLWDEWARKHTRRCGRRHSRTGCRGIVASFSASKPVGQAGEDGRGLCTVSAVCPTASAEGTIGRYTIRPVLSKVILYYLLLLLELLHFYCRVKELHIQDLKFLPRGLYREGEEVVGIHAAGIGEVRRLHDIICISLWSAAGFDTHSLPSFPAAG